MKLAGRVAFLAAPIAALALLLPPEAQRFSRESTLHHAVRPHTMGKMKGVTGRVQPNVGGALRWRGLSFRERRSRGGADDVRTGSPKCSYTLDNARTLVDTPHGPYCPSSCPFTQRLSGDHCKKVCVEAELCSTFHPARAFADPHSKECVPACGKRHIPGCKSCVGEGVCAQCVGDLFYSFKLSADGKMCLNRWWFVWTVVYFMLAGVLVFFIYYAVCLLVFRSPKGSTMMRRALRHRRLCYPSTFKFEEDTGTANWQNFPRWSNPHTKCISGMGVQLYFNWLLFCGTCALLLWIAANVAVLLSGHLYEAKDEMNSRTCNIRTYSGLSGRLLESTRDFRVNMFVCLGVAYLMILVVSWVVIKWQHQIIRELYDSEDVSSSYVLKLTNLPPEATEETLVMAVRARLALGDSSEDDVVGASVSYDMSGHEGEIANAVNKMICEQHGRRSSVHFSMAAPETAADRMQQSSLWRLGFVDNFLLAGFQDPPEAKDIVSVLQELRCSGTAFVVMNTIEALGLLEAVLKEDPMVLGVPVTFKRLRRGFNPMSVLWSNIRRNHGKKRKGIAGTFLICLTIVLWGLLYMPYAVETVTYTRVPGGPGHALAQVILGMLIGLGNFMVGNVIECVMTWIGFNSKDNRDSAVLVFAFFANMLNVFADVWLITQVVYGVQLGSAFEGDRVGYDKVFIRELFSIIHPGYLFLPYIMQFCCLVVLPYWILRRVLQSRRLDRLRAERVLQAPDFDIVWRYADILCNFSICMLLFFTVTRSTAISMLYLCLFVVLIYAMDHWLLLRWTSQSFFNTSLLSTIFAMLWSFPTGCLAAVVGWWGFKAGLLHRLLGSPESFDFSLIVVLPLLHLVMYFAGFGWIYRNVRKDGVHYTGASSPHIKSSIGYHRLRERLHERGEFFDFFNTNHVLCLRSRHLKKLSIGGTEAQVILPYVKGKSYMLDETIRTAQFAGVMSNDSNTVHNLFL